MPDHPLANVLCSCENRLFLEDLLRARMASRTFLLLCVRVSRWMSLARVVLRWAGAWILRRMRRLLWLALCRRGTLCVSRAMMRLGRAFVLTLMPLALLSALSGTVAFKVVVATGILIA